MHPDQGKLRSGEVSGSAPDEAGQGQAGGAPAADVGPVGRTPDTAREQDAGVSGGTGATGATALDRATSAGGHETAEPLPGTDDPLMPGEGGDDAAEEVEDVGVTSPGGDGTDREFGRDTARGDLVGTATGDLGGADPEDLHEARTTGAHEDQS
jgi:hypothetical protein